MSSPEELSSASERSTVPETAVSEVPGEQLKDAEVTVPDDDRPQAPLVLDASFVLAVLDGEPAAMRLVDLLRGSVLPSPTAGEVYLKVAERSGLAPDQVEAVLIAYGVRLVDLPTLATHRFIDFRRTDRAHRQQTVEADVPLSLGALCVLGYALHTGQDVLSGDRNLVTTIDKGRPSGVRAFLYSQT